MRRGLAMLAAAAALAALAAAGGVFAWLAVVLGLVLALAGAAALASGGLAPGEAAPAPPPPAPSPLGPPDLDRRNRELEALCAVARAVGSGADLRATAEETLDVVRTVARMDVGVLYRLDDAAGRLELVASRGLGAEDVARVRTRALEATRAGEAIRTGRLVVADLEASGPGGATLGEAREAGRHRTELALPVPVHDRAWGVLVLASAERRTLDGDEPTLLLAVAHQVGLAVHRATLFAETRAKSRRLETLARLARRLNATLSVDQVTERVAAAALELFESDMARLWLTDDDGAHVTLRAAAGPDEGPVGVTRIRVGEGLVGGIVATRGPIAIADVRTDPRIQNLSRLRAEGIVSAAGAPLLVGDRVLGALAIGVRRPHGFGAEEMDLLQSLANQAAIALDNARLFRDEQTRRAYLGAVLEINTKIGAMAPTEPLLASIAEEAARLLDVDNAGFRLLEGEDLVIAGLAGLARETMIKPRLRVGESVSGKVVASGRTLLLDIEEVPDIVPEHLAADRRLGYTKFLGVPLRVGDRIIGVLTFRARRPFTGRDQELAEAFAGQAAIALEHTRLFREAERHAARMRALADLGRVVSETLDPDVVNQRVADSIRALLGARSSVLYRCAAGGTLEALTTSRDLDTFEWMRTLEPGVGIAGLAVRERGPVATPDARADARILYPPDLLELTGASSHRALLAVPLVARDRLLGALAVADVAGRVFDDEEIRLAQAFADAAAVALENARLYVETARRRHEAEELARLARELTENLEVAAVVERTVASVIPLFGARSSVVRLLQPDGSLVALAVGGDARRMIEPGHVLAPGQGVHGRAAAEGRPVTTVDLASDLEIPLPEALRRGIDAEGEGAILAVPLRAHDLVIGVLGIADRTGRVFTPDEAALLQGFADQATLALENARLFSTERARRRQIAGLAEVERELAAELDSRRLPQLIVERAARLFAGAGALFLGEDDETLARVAVTANLPPDAFDARVAVGQGLAGAAAGLRRGLLVNDYAQSRHADPALVAAGVRHGTAQPLAVRERLLGVLVVARTGGEAAPFTTEDLALLESYAAQAAIALDNARLYQAVEARAARLRALARVNQLVASSLDPDEVLHSIARAAEELMHAPFVAFWVADEAARRLEMRVFTEDRDGAPYRVERLEFGQGVVGWVAEHRRPVTIDDVFADGRFYRPEWARRRGLRSMLASPVVHRDTLLGVLALVGDAPFRLGPDDEELLQSFSAQAATALANARLYQETRRYAERLHALEEVNRLVSSSLEPEEVLRNLARAIAGFLDAPCVGVWGLDEATGRLRRALAHGDPVVAAALPDSLALGEGAVGWTALHRQPIPWTDVRADERLVERVGVVGLGLPWITTYPILLGDRLLGAVAVHRAEPLPATPETPALMGSLVAQAAAALDNARLYSETSRRLAETRALLEVAELLNSSLESRQLLKHVAVKVARVCRVDRCTIEQWDGDRVIPLTSQFADGRRVPRMWQALQALVSEPPAAVPANARVIETRQPLVIEDASASTLIPRAWVDAFGLGACLIVPLVRQEKVIGVMTLDYADGPRRFEPWQQDLAMAIAGQLAFALENARLYAEVQARLHETSALLLVGRALSRPGPTDVVMRAVAAEVGHAFRADMVGVYLMDQSRQALAPAAGYHVPRELVEFFRNRPLVLERSPGLAPAIRDRRTVWSPDVHAAPEFEPEWTGALPPFSMVFTPTLVRGETVGGLFLIWWKTGRAPTAAEVRLLEGVAAQVGLAIENADLSRQTQARLAEAERLLSVSRALSSTLDFRSLVRHFLRQVAAALDCESVGLWTVDRTGEWLEPLQGYRVPPEKLAVIRDAKLSLVEHAFYREAVQTRRPVVSTDVPNDPRVPDAIRAISPHRAHIFVPIVVKDRMIGGFAAAWWERPHEFNASELSLVETIAHQAGAALENARLFDENRRRVEELSVLHDFSRAVTGELDRAALVAALRAAIDRVLDARNLVVMLRDDERGDIEVALRVEEGVVRMRPPLRYATQNVGLASIVLARRRALRTDDYVGECVRQGVEPIATSAHLRHWLGVPLAAGDRVLGVALIRSVERAFTEADEELLANIGQLAALALRSAWLYDERARAYRDLAAAQDQLVRTEKLRALGEMASGVAHDFNNLLASVLGRAQLLLRRVQDPQQRQWLQVIERSALDGAQTVKRLQEFTRIRRDRSLVAVDLNEVVNDALEITQSRWREEPASRGVTVDVRTLLSPLPAVTGDAAELREAMTNLILNALDAMPDGGTLTLRTAALGDRIEVTVADSGVGMPPAVRERIFDPFFTTKGPLGTGLGLSMTYGIVARHGGRIAVESEEGRGSTFRLSFPRGDAPAAGEAAPVETAPPGRALRCLVVDDEPAVRSVLVDVLESAGHTVVSLGDGAEALARVQAERFDLVLTDLAMPRVTGWQVARAVKAAHPETPVFLVTGFGVELSAEERRAHGVDLVLVKPLQIQEILDAVADVARVRGAA